MRGLTVDPVNRRRWTVVVIPLSQTGPKGFPLYVPIASISVGSQAVVDQIRVVDRERLLKLEGTATESEMRLLAEAMKDVFGLH